MAITHCLIWNPMGRPSAPITDEFIDNITTGVRDFIAGAHTQLAHHSMMLLADLIVYTPFDPRADDRWQLVVATILEPSGFQAVVNNMLVLAMLRRMIESSGDPTGAVQSQINSIRGSIMQAADRIIASW